MSDFIDSGHMKVGGERKVYNYPKSKNPLDTPTLTTDQQEDLQIVMQDVLLELKKLRTHMELITDERITERDIYR